MSSKNLKSHARKSPAEPGLVIGPDSIAIFPEGKDQITIDEAGLGAVIRLMQMLKDQTAAAKVTFARPMAPIPTLAQLQAAGPTAEAWLDDLRRTAAWLYRLASNPETRAGIEAKIELLDAREAELHASRAEATP